VDNAGYVALTRQSGLLAQMQAVANNIANASTTGFKAEGVAFSEFVRATGPGAPSLSMAAARLRATDWDQGAVAATGGPFDLALEGEGFFLIETPEGARLTRAGAFRPNEMGDLVTAEGFRVLDAGGAPVFLPQGSGAVAIAPDGTVSAGGLPVGQLGVVVPRDPLGLLREGGTRFAAPGGWDPAPAPRVLQGFLEGSNVQPVLEVARMIAVGRAYELGQSFLEREDERIRATIRAIHVR
jgi:flagellar basal-body rod protein FlgF